MTLLVGILCGLAGVSAVIYALGFWATVKRRAHRPRRAPGAELPPVSILKPIKGEEEELRENLRSIFESDYPAPVEVIFASTDLADPGIVLARAIADEFPEVPSRFVLADPGYGLNPKVCNLAAAMDVARYDLLWQSDANVRVEPSYLRKVVGEMIAEDAHMLTSIVVGTGEVSRSAALENLQMSAFIAPGMCAALEVAGIHCVCGKSMLFRRSELDEIGGIGFVRDILCEDFILGREYHRRGRKVVLSATLVRNVNRTMGFERFWSRHSRWLKMRTTLHLGGFFADLGSNPVALLALAVLVSGFEGWVLGVFGLVVVLKTITDAMLLRIARGESMAPQLVVLAPLKDLLMAVIWVYALFSRSVRWRGTKLRFGKDTRLRPDDGALPVRVLLRPLWANTHATAACGRQLH
ncbi:MAG: glycosyltransferase [Myxococcota bacterium]